MVTPSGRVNGSSGNQIPVIDNNSVSGLTTGTGTTTMPAAPSGLRSATALTASASPAKGVKAFFKRLGSQKLESPTKRRNRRDSDADSESLDGAKFANSSSLKYSASSSPSELALSEASEPASQPASAPASPLVGPRVGGAAFAGTDVLSPTLQHELTRLSASTTATIATADQIITSLTARQNALRAGQDGIATARKEKAAELLTPHLRQVVATRSYLQSRLDDIQQLQHAPSEFIITDQTSIESRARSLRFDMAEHAVVLQRQGLLGIWDADQAYSTAIPQAVTEQQRGRRSVGGRQARKAEIDRSELARTQVREAHQATMKVIDQITATLASGVADDTTKIYTDMALRLKVRSTANEGAIGRLQHTTTYLAIPDAAAPNRLRKFPPPAVAHEVAELAYAHALRLRQDAEELLHEVGGPLADTPQVSVRVPLFRRVQAMQSPQMQRAVQAERSAISNVAGKVTNLLGPDNRPPHNLPLNTKRRQQAIVAIDAAQASIKLLDEKVSNQIDFAIGSDLVHGSPDNSGADALAWQLRVAPSTHQAERELIDAEAARQQLDVGFLGQMSRKAFSGARKSASDQIAAYQPVITAATSDVYEKVNQATRVLDLAPAQPSSQQLSMLIPTLLQQTDEVTALFKDAQFHIRRLTAPPSRLTLGHLNGLKRNAIEIERYQKIAHKMTEQIVKLNQHATNLAWIANGSQTQTIDAATLEQRLASIPMPVRPGAGD